MLCVLVSQLPYRPNSSPVAHHLGLISPIAEKKLPNFARRTNVTSSSLSINKAVDVDFAFGIPPNKVINKFKFHPYA